MATEAITKEQATANFQEAEDKAIMAGADMQESSSIRERYGMEPVEFYEEDLAPISDEEELMPIEGPSLSPTTYPDSAATDLAAASTLMSGDETSFDRNKKELVNKGYSEEVDMHTAHLNKEHKEMLVSAAALALNEPTLSDEEKTSVINSLQKSVAETFPYDVADEVTIRYADEAFLDATTEDDATVAAKNAESLEQKLHYRNVIVDAVSRAGEEALNVSLKGAGDIARQLVSSVDDVATYNEIAELLDVDVDASLAPGSILAQLKEKIGSYETMKEKADAALMISEYLKENAGAVSELMGSNMVSRAFALSDLFSNVISEDPDGWWERLDVDEILLDFGPIVDAMVVASGVGALAKSSYVTGKLRKLAGLPRIDAANPKKAADLAEQAMVEPKIAEMVGTSAEELKIAAAPKVEGWKEGQMSGRTASSINRMAESEDLLKAADNVEDFILNLRGRSAAEANVQALSDIARGMSYWVADTDISGSLGKNWKASVLIGKTQDRGFATFKEAKTVLDEDITSSGQILTRTSRLDSLKPVVQKGQEQKAAIKQLRSELETLKATKLSRGEEKALRKEANKLKATIAERQREIAAAEKGLAGGTQASRTSKVEGINALKREMQPMEMELAEIQQFLDVSTTGAKAEANISRLDGLHLDKLDADVKARLDALQKDVLVSEGREASEHVEYFVKADTEGSIAFADGDVAIAFGGSKGTWVFDADSAIAADIAQAGHALFDKWKWAEQQLLNYLDPLARLSRGEQVKVSKALAEGNRVGKVFNATDLKAMGITDNKSIEAYREYRRFADVMFDLEDSLYLKTLRNEDMKRVVSGDFKSYAKPLSAEQAKEVKYAYDAEAGTIVQINAAEEIKGGATIARLRKNEFVEGYEGKVGASHIIVRGNTKLEELPETGLLNKVEGYVPMTHKSNYFITKTDDVIVDGTTTTRETTVGVVGSINEAKAAIKNLEEAGETGYGLKHDRALLAGDRSFEDHMMDLHSIRGTLFYGGRSESGLKGFGGAADRLVDPLEAAVKAASRISRDITLKPFIDDMKARFVKSYNEMLPNKGVYPAHAMDIRKTGQLADWQVVEARRAFAHIETLEGLSTQAGFRRAAIQAADLVDGKFVGGETLAKGLRSASELDPIGAVRSFNFNVNLRSNPLAQLIVQPAQTLNMIGLHPATFVQDFSYGRKITLAARHKLDVVGSDKELAMFAKTSGKTVDEVKKDIKAFRESGMGQAVTAHETARDAAKPLSTAINAGPVRRAASLVASPVSKTLNFLGQGFNRGEEINLGLHYMVARRRWVAKNPGKDVYSPTAQLEIAGEARALSGSMVQTGDFAYQKGIFAIPFQYAAIQQKQLLLMTTNKALTKGERIRIAAAQTAMWGPAGIGLGFVVDSAASHMGVDLSEGASKFFNDGLMEWGLNSFLTYITDEETDLDFSGRFAPASGLFGDNIYSLIAEAITSGEARDIYKVFFGPTANNFNRANNAIDTVVKMFGTDDVAFKELAIPVDAVLDVFSGWNNTTKAMLFSEKEAFTDTKGNKLFRDPTQTELWAMGSIGLVPKEIDAYYKLKLNKQKWDEHLTEVADEYYSHILRLTDSAYDRQAATGWKIMGNADEQYINMLRVEKAVVDKYEGDAPKIMSKLVDKIKSNISTVGSDDLINSIHKLSIAHGGSSDVQGMVQYAINTGLMKEEDRQQIQDFLTHLTGE